MEPIELLITETRATRRQDYMVEQGIPVHPTDPAQVDKLVLVDESGDPVPASIQVEGTDQHGRARWLFVSFPITLDAGSQRRFRLQETESPPRFEHGIDMQTVPGKILLRTRFFELELADPGGIRLTTEEGDVLNGAVGFEIISDARSAVGNLRPIHYEPGGYEIIEST
ncbi:MAG: hypothetical protein ACPL7K_03325, partial [Armatimonadota bacterium]